MAFRIGRTLPPAAAPIYLRDIVSGIAGLFRGSKAVTRFEGELKEYFGVEHCFTVSSGKAALTVILQSLKAMHPDRDEVLIPAFTCFSLPSAIIRAGLKVRLCDVGRDTYDFDYDQLSAIISADCGRILCVVPVHLLGFPADMRRIKKLVAERGIPVVEDAAQSMGGESAGTKLGSSGDVGFFSLGRGKALSTVEGGIILTQRSDIASHLGETLSGCENYGMCELFKLFCQAVALLVFLRPSLFWFPRMLPFLRLGETIYDPGFPIRKMSPFQAGLARGWVLKLVKMTESRAANIRRFVERLTDVGLKPSWAHNVTLPILIRFPLRIESKETKALLLDTSNRMGLGIAASYPDTVDSICDAGIEKVPGGFAVAKEYAEQIVTLPVHQYLTEIDADNILELLKEVKS